MSNGTVGVGGKTMEQALGELSNMTSGVPKIATEEFKQRLEKLQALMREKGVGAVYLHAGTNLYYFTGLKWGASERMVAAIVPAEGEIVYIAPKFELDTLRDYWKIPAEIHAWEEHESPYTLLGSALKSLGVADKQMLLDEVAPYFIVHGIKTANPDLELGHAQPLTQASAQPKV